MKRISNWLKQNPMLKLASLLLAFLIWITVVNFSNPEVTDYVNVELEVRNAEELTSADQMYSLDARTVRVSFHVRTRYMNQITASDFTAYVDLQDYSITGAVPVYVEPDSSISSLISDVSSNPMVVHVTTEDMQEKRFDVGVRFNGEPAEGYALGDTDLSSDHIYVRGPVSEIGTISSVGIEINTAEATSDLSGTAPLVFYDANGHSIEIDERVEASLGEISYTQEVCLVKSLSISAGTTGTPASGYIFEGVETSPAFVSVYGNSELLDSYSSIEIPDEVINIEGASRNVTLSIDISPYIPEGLTLYEASPQITAIARIRRAPETEASEIQPTAESQEQPETGVSSAAETAETGQTITQPSHGSGTGTAETAADNTSPANGQETAPSDDMREESSPEEAGL